MGGNLGKKRMAGIDGFEGVKPIDYVRVDVFEKKDGQDVQVLKSTPIFC